MSISAWLEIKSIDNIQPIVLLNKLIQLGWIFSDNGLKTFLPLGDNDNFDWQSENVYSDYLFDIFRQKFIQNELIGVVMTWSETMIGGEFLVCSEGRLNISLSLNRLTTIAGITDVNWYIDKIIPVFNDLHYEVELISFNQHI